MTPTKAVCYILFTWANLGIYIFFLVTAFRSALRYSKKKSLLLIAFSFLLTAVFEVLFLEAESLFAIYRPVMRFVMVLLNSALALLLIQKQPIQICFSVFMTLTIQSNTIAAGELLVELDFLPTLIEGFPGFNFLLYTLCILLIFCPLLYLLFCKFLRRTMELGLDLRQWRGLLLLPVLHFIYQMCSGNGGALAQPATWGSLFNLLLFHFCTVITYIAVIQLLLYSHDKYEAINRAELTAQQLTLQEERYEMLQSHVTETNRLLHDWRHHMLAFRGFIARDDRDGLSAYLDRLGDVYHVSESPPLCARTAVDVILRHYLGLAADHGITVTTHVTGDVRIDGTTTNQFKLQTGTVAVDGAIKINNGTSVITLLTGSTAAQRYTVTYDQAVPLAANKVIFAAGSSGVAIATDLAKKVTVSGGSNADQEWVTVASGNDVVLKLAKEYYVSATGDDASIGSFSAPKKTIAGAYAAGLAANEVGLDIRVLSDLPDTGATAFAEATITSVKISSYSGENVKATTPWTITRAAAPGNLLSITAGSVNLTNLTLDGKGIDATASLVNVGAGASLTLKDKTTLCNNKNVTASGRGGGIYTAGAVTMDAGSLVTGNSLTGTGSAYGGGIYVAAGGAFSMNGGAITNNTVTASGGSGGAIMIDPDATNVTARIGGNSVLSGNSCGANGSAIHGGGAGSAILFSGSARVTGNQITGGSHLGGAVFPYGGTLTISDNVQISGNTNPNNQSCNVYLASGKTIAIGGAHMGESSGIGVYCAVVPTVAGATTTIATNAIAADKTHFLSDRSLTEAGIDFDCSTVLLSYDARYIPTPGGGDGGDGGSGGSGGGTKPTPPPVVPGKITPVDPHTNGVSKLLQVDKPLAYLNGGKTGLFYPTSGITRGEVAQLFYNLLLDQTAPEAPRAFTDVPAGMWCEQAIQKLTDMGILKGIDGKLFAPNALITRAEFTAIAVRFATGISSGTLHFPDVPAGYWAAGTINTAAQYGWISGFADGNFYPTAAINRAQTAKIVNNMLGRFPDKSQIDGKKDLKTFPDVSADYWAYYEIAEASNALDHGTAKK